MTSSLQAEAARLNGARSNGPVTPEGRAASARNSLRHGLCSATFVLEDPAERAEFEALKRDLVMTHQAVDAAQTRVVEQMAIAMWRQNIVANLEFALWKAVGEGLATAEAGGDGLLSLASVNRYRGRIERDLKLAEAALEKLQAARVKAMQARLVKAREFSSLNILDSLQSELGPEGFAMFRSQCTNEPEAKVAETVAETAAPAETMPAKPVVTPNMNRRARRRAEKLAKKAAR